MPTSHIRKHKEAWNLGTIGEGKKQKIEHHGLLSNYCGPGGTGDARHPTDAACQDHDQDYGEMQAAGEKPYLVFGEADQTLLHKLNKRRQAITQELQTNGGNQELIK